MLAFLILTMVAASASALGAWWIIRRAHVLGLIDQPGQRRMHRIPTPRGGGIGMVVALLLTILLASLFGLWPLFSSVYAFAALLVLAVVGFTDDRRGLPVLPRLAAHGVASLALAWSLLYLHAEPSWLLCLLLASVFPFAINLSNFLDGLNGILTLQLLVPLLALCFILPVHSPLLPLAIAGAVALVCFLPFNFPDARCFMGDAASSTIGTYVAWLGLAAILRDEFDPLLFLLLNSPLLIDTLLTLGRRALVGKKFWRAHREHLYQWWARTGLSATAVNGRYLLWSGASWLLWQTLLLRLSTAWAWATAALWFMFGAWLWRRSRTLLLHHRRHRNG